ncbi:inner ear-specific collagen-like [Dendronephthya gigantea]|uniref:inner ear-specific collagen-like n=1 Tax=Dendronephthya gigantea TaxID=151771 RepID=UPI00106A1D0B|nr:inner ear-specific collagen-like [Dendronephthya gigantea]
MASKGTKYVELPVYVINIGLLYGVLVTSGLVLAWVTIYRHEQSIAELRLMLNTQEVENKVYPSQAVNTAVVTSGKNDILIQEDDDEEIDESRPRLRRAKGKKRKRKTECNEKCVGQKGAKGEKGAKGKKGRGKPGKTGPRGPRGDRGERGFQGPTGNTGDKGDRGIVGNIGDKGEKGDKGEEGIPGIKGDEGKPGEALMYSESAHIVGSGDMVPSAPAPGDVYKITSWKEQHRSGEMEYDQNGHLTINIEGVYFVYSQMFYFDRNNTYTGFNVYVDNRRILKAIYSIVDFHRPYHTQFISGVFKINKGQRIWVGTTIKRKYFFNESSAFFGAFMLHP